MTPRKGTPETLAREIAARMQNEWKEGIKRNELRKKIAAEYGLNAEQVRRYLRILHLTPELLQMVNDGKLTLHAGAELSFLPEENQKTVYRCLKDTACSVSVREAANLKKKFCDKPLQRLEVERLVADSEGIEVWIPYGRTDMNSVEELAEKSFYEKVYRILHNWEEARKVNIS